MSKPQGKIYLQFGLSEDEASKYAELLNRLEKIDRGQETEPLTENEKKFIKYIDLKIESQ